MPGQDVCANLGYVVTADGESVYHPGDALAVPDVPVTTLLVPMQASWLKTEEAIGFVRAVRPDRAVGIHDGQVNDRARDSINHWLATEGGADYHWLAPGTTLGEEDGGRPRVSQLRLVVEADDFDAAVAFYRDALGLPVELDLEGDGGEHVLILDAGRATLELSNPAQVAMIDDVEVGRRVAPRLRVAFEVDDAARATDALVAAGAELVAPPTRTPWDSLNAGSRRRPACSSPCSRRPSVRLALPSWLASPAAGFSAAPSPSRPSPGCSPPAARTTRVRPSGGARPPERGPWTWTDDLGQEVSLDATPTRIAAYGDAAAALLNFGITPVALFHYMDPEQDSTFEDLDLSDVEIVGSAYGEISLEALAATRPELDRHHAVRRRHPGLDVRLQGRGAAGQDQGRSPRSSASCRPARRST